MELNQNDEFVSTNISPRMGLWARAYVELSQHCFDFFAKLGYRKK